MKCPHCNTHVAKIPINWKCPHCNEKLPEPGFWFNFFEGFTEYLQDKGSLFWGIILGCILIILGSVEIIFGNGFLLGFIGHNLFFALLMMLFGGMLINMYMKIILPLHLQFGSDFIVRERKVIRNIRKGTNLAAIVAISTCLLWLGPSTFLKYFHSYLVILGFFLALAWAISSLFLDVRMAEDVRFRHYMERLGVSDLKRLRKISTMTIGALFVAAITYWVLNQMPGLWNTISNWGLVGTLIFFVKNYLSWIV